MPVPTLLTLLLACDPVVPKLDDSAGTPDTDTDTDPAPDTDTDTDTVPDTDTDTGGDSATDTDTYEQPPEEVIADRAVSVHPEVATILVARWTQLYAAESAWLSWTLDGTDHASPAAPLDVGPAEEVVLGLPAGTTVPLTLHLVFGGVERTVALGDGTTGALPANLVLPTLTTADPATMRPEPWLLASVDVGTYDFFGPCYVVILDAQARVVWYRAVSGSRLTLFPRVSATGGYLSWDATTYYTYGDVHPSVTRATIDLVMEEETVIDNMGLGYWEMDDGSFLFDEYEDAYHYYLSRQYPDGTRERIWACADWMASYSTGYWACAPNTVLYEPGRGTVLWSMFQTSTVAEVDLATGTLVREFGQYPGGFAFDPESANFSLQHWPNWTADGTLIVSTHVPGQPGVQYAREFVVDDATQTLQQVWSYTPAAGHYADYAGQVTRLANGNALWSLGTAGVLHEATADGEVAWEASWGGHLTGNLTPIADLYALRAGW